ncbi:WD40 repeat-like protein [Cystobasidium minutum MCA 4210]|uniref:WD40 repeat-like protein n=1 Tax=Cystobasidium minutum MCA 4210 TaxID=1397322 RepID=UPI0034CEC631|eukprot:jgi/Rhomi1/166071/fgenesh1_kg.1_\
MASGGGPDYLDYRSPCQTFALAISSGTSSSSKTSSPYPQSIAPFHSDLKLCVGSYIETAASNNITVLGLNPQLLQDPEGFAYNNHREDDPSPSSSGGAGGDFVPLARADTPYPATKVDFSPSSLAGRLQNTTNTYETREMIASTSDSLRLWDLTGPSEGRGSSYVGRAGQASHSLVERSALTNKPLSERPAPLTSFDWSTINPSYIVTSSIDTTCTVWDISTNAAVTQLIAHDKEVFDVVWSPASSKVFASAGADGSVRSFDLRALETSTILYDHESASASSGDSKRSGRGTPLLRLAFNPTDPNTLAVVHADNPSISILDVRSPGLPLAELHSHTAPVNGIAWCGSSVGSGNTNTSTNGYSNNGEYTDGSGAGNAMLASISDDHQVLLWDLMRPNPQGEAGGQRKPQPLPRPIGLPNAAYTAPRQLDSVAWGAGREYLAVTMGDTVRCLRV